MNISKCVLYDIFVLHFLQCDPATHSTSRTMPEFDILMSPVVDQLTTDPLVELDGITYVLYNTTYWVIWSEFWYIAIHKITCFLLIQVDSTLSFN